MSLVREQLLAAVLTALNTGMPAGVITTTRDRGIEVTSAEVPTSSLYFLEEEVVRGNARHPLVVRRMTIGLEATAKGDVSTRPSTKVQPQLSWYTKALVDQTLGGLANDINEVKHKARVVQGEHAFIQVITHYRIDYQTRAADADLRV